MFTSRVHSVPCRVSVILRIPLPLIAVEDGWRTSGLDCADTATVWTRYPVTPGTRAVTSRLPVRKSDVLEGQQRDWSRELGDGVAVDQDALETLAGRQLIAVMVVTSGGS